MNEPKSIRQMVDIRMASLRDTDSLEPIEISRLLVELSSLYSNILKESVDREFWYAELLKRMLEEHKTAAKARIFAEACVEHRQLLEAKAYEKAVLEIIRAGKKYVNFVENEKREGIY